MDGMNHGITLGVYRGYILIYIYTVYNDLTQKGKMPYFFEKTNCIFFEF